MTTRTINYNQLLSIYSDKLDCEGKVILMMEEMIKDILQKHNIKDENLAMALAEIYDLFLKEVESDLVSKVQRDAAMKGIQL